MSKIVIISTYGKDDIERANLPWAVANAAITFDHEVLVFLQGPAVNLARKDYLNGLTFPPFPPIEDLIKSFIEAGGKIFICGPCIKAHDMDENNITEGMKPAGAAFLVKESLDAIVYSY